MTFGDFTEQLRQVRPTAVMLGETSVDRDPVYAEWDAQQQKDTAAPAPLLDQLAFHGDVRPFSESDIAMLERATRGQAGNPIWMEQRKGRCTASKLYEVFTHMRSFESNPKADMSTLVDTILGLKTVPKDIPAIKYGIRMEPVAAQDYYKLQCKRHHRPLQVKECGLFVDKDHPYIGASPDRLVSFCCGEGVLEIKTSLACTTTGTAPTPKLLPYLVETDGTVSLKKKHAHYVQVQAQTALTGRKWADFLVYSSAGCCVERILFDQQLWMLVKEKAVQFCKNVCFASCHQTHGSWRRGGDFSCCYYRT